MRDITLADTFYAFFTSRAFATGVPTVLAGTPVVSAYENDSVTQITAGITLGVSHDSVVGLNLLTIVATGANGYEAGKDYTLVITTGTVGGVSVVGEVVGEFSIGRSAAAVDLANGTDGLGAIKTDTGTTLPALLPAALVGGRIDANVGAISGDATAADNLESQYDTTGLTGDTFPSTQGQLAGITNVGSSINTPPLAAPAGFTITTGGAETNDEDSAQALDGTYHSLADDGLGVLEAYYEFNVGSGIPTAVEWTGYLTGNNDSLGVYGYDWVAAAWVQIGTLTGKNSTANEVNSYSLFTSMVGSGGDEGTVRVRFYAASGLTSALLATDQVFVSFSRGSEGYDNGAIWIDTTGSNTGVVVGIDGVARNPVSTIAAANTLSASTNLNRFQVAPGSTITLAATQSGQLFDGHGWVLALGGQDIDESHFFNAAVSGVATAASEMEFHDCEISSMSAQNAHWYDCTFDGTVTITATGDFHIINGHSGVAGSGVPIFDLGAAIGATTMEFRRWSGGLQLDNVQAGDVVSVDAISGGTITVNGTGGTVHVRGMVAVTDGSGGSVTIVQTQVLNITDLNAEMDTAISDAALATAAAVTTVDTVVDAIKAVTDLLTAATTEPTGVPSATETPLEQINRLHQALRNGLTVTNSAKTFLNDAGASLWSKALSDDGSTYTEAEGS